ncbi:MAG: glycerol kinase [Nitrospirota bacterium]
MHVWDPSEGPVPYILAMDQGTTGSWAIVIAHDGTIKGSAYRELAQRFPRAGWRRIRKRSGRPRWTSRSRRSSGRTCGRTISLPSALPISVKQPSCGTAQRARRSTRPSSGRTRRSADLCDRLRADGCEPLVQRRTGLQLDPYFSGTKVAWILDHVPDVRRRAEDGTLAFGTVDSWLVWKLTGGRLHVTDPSNALRTMLFNIQTGRWDEELLRLFRIPAGLLPDVLGSSEVYGAITAVQGLQQMPIGSLLGDQQAALFGQLCVSPGTTKNTYGTGCFLRQHIGDKPVASRHGLVTTVAWNIRERMQYALEGSVLIGGAVVQWLRDGLGLIRSAAESETLARSVSDNGGVYFVPAFTGLGAPHWDPYARGLLVGLTRGTTFAHLARAALESIAYQVADVLDAMRDGSGFQVEELRVDGGASRNDWLMQFQSDLLGLPVIRSTVTETTAQGAAYLAGLAVGFWTSQQEFAGRDRIEHRFEPQILRGQATALRERWTAAVMRSKGWETSEHS